MAKIRPGPKKGFPSNFLLLLLVVFLTILGMQTLGSSGEGKVSFSHQAEHLTNLNLTLPEESRKIAQSENLVTFTGKFREELSSESNDRFRYLELLNEHHQLASQAKEVLDDLEQTEKQVKEAADLYLHLSGSSLPRSGYTIVSALYDTPKRDNAIILHSLSDREVPSLPFVQSSVTSAQQQQSPETIDAAGKGLNDLVSLLRSVALGIGSEPLKKELKSMASNLNVAQEQSYETRLKTYRNVLNQLTPFIGNLGKQEDGVRLESLRSVRNYVERAKESETLFQKLEKNTALLDKARGKVSSVIWFFNNQELSTRALERQDPEVFSNWFAQAEQEWSRFEENRGLNYRAPDQPRNAVLEKTFKSEEPAP